MNWCQEHWELLKQTIKDKGLWEFVDVDGTKTFEHLAKTALDIDESEEERFDPLIGSWIRINTYMLESPALHGRIFQCPLCILVNDGVPHLVQNWLEGCVGSAYDYAVEKGLIIKQ